MTVTKHSDTSDSVQTGEAGCCVHHDSGEHYSRQQQWQSVVVAHTK